MDKKLENFNVLELTVYKSKRGQWVFDDSDVELTQEPFVAGADLIMDELVKTYKSPQNGFKLFIREAVPDDIENAIECIHSEKLTHPLIGDSNYYRCSTLNRRIWLCPALYRYISYTPQVLWFWAEEIEEVT